MNFEHIFNELDIDAQPFALCELLGRCDMGLGYRTNAVLHYILAGEGEILVSGKTPIPLQAGTLVLIPATRDHTLRSFGRLQQTGPQCHPAEVQLAHHLMQSGEQEAGSGLIAICSDIQIGLRGTGGVIDLIREPLIQKILPGSSLEGVLNNILLELSSPKLGSRAMIRVMLMQCFIQLLRSRLESDDPNLTWMAALADERLWTALHHMIGAPGDLHTVESLASLVGMSRSTFAKRFSEVYGNGPMALLRTLRMQKAASLLSKTDLPIKRVAEKVGFQSRTTFSRKFEEMIGTTPSLYRNGTQHQ